MQQLEKYKNGRRKKEIDLSTMIYGKVPPQALEIEGAVLGAIMLQKDAFDLAFEIIKTPEVFYSSTHQYIFAAMIELNKRSNPIDELTVVEELRKLEKLDICGGPYYITKLTSAVTSAANIEYHCKVIIEKYVKREVIRISAILLDEAYEDSSDAFDMIDQAEAAIFKVANYLNTSDIDHLSNYFVPAIQDLAKKIEAAKKSDYAISGVTSGFRSIDRITHGWQASDLIILAARPSVGKTAFALNLARNAALPSPESGLPKTTVAVFSLEMSAQQLVQRLWASESEINLDKITKGRLSEEEEMILYQRAIQPLSEANIYVDDTPAINIFTLRTKCRRLKTKFGVGLIIIDYLQLMSGTGKGNGNREQEVSEISRNLKALAKELKVPIIALSQLSRQVETRSEKNKMPVLSDLRESGAIEQDADSVLFIYRPEYHNIHHNETGGSSAGETHIRFAKHRNGVLDTVKLRAQLWIQKFIEYVEEVPGFKSPLNQGNGLYNLGTGAKVNNQLEDDGTLPF